MRSYRPRRSKARWLEGAPAPVLACYDSGPNKGQDRYTVLYGAPLWAPSYGNTLPARAMCANPFHPCGIGLYIEVPAFNRSAFGRKIPFSHLPEDCKRLVRRDCEESADV